MKDRISIDDWIVRALDHPKIKSAIEAGRTVTNLSPDPDVLGATTGQAHLLIRGIPSWNPQMTDEFFMHTYPIALKLTALRYHLRRYREMQEKRVAEVPSNDLVLEAFKKGLRFCEMEMLFEVEVLFFQYKSALDMLVKVLCPITGKSAGKFSTYRKSGADVIKQLNQVKKDKTLNLTSGRVDWLIEFIEGAKSPWLESVIKIRDTFSHYRSDMEFGFYWDASTESICPPVFATTSGLRQFDLVMEELIENLITYCTNFIAIAVSCAIPLEQEIQGMSDNDRAFIGARWNQDLSRAIWKPASNVLYEYTEEDIERARQLARADNL
jgi:hypothetical protein